jgi:hypothetical protein
MPFKNHHTGSQSSTPSASTFGDIGVGSIEINLQGSHIIRQKNGVVTDAAAKLLDACGINDMYHPSNGLTLCCDCHTM